MQKIILEVKKEVFLSDEAKQEKRKLIPLLDWLKRHPLNNVLIHFETNILYTVEFLKPLSPYHKDELCDELLSKLLEQEQIFNISVELVE